MLSLIILRYYKGVTSILNSALLHQQTDYKCPAMSDCPYTGNTLVERRELPPLPPTLGKIWELSDRKKKGFLDKQDFLLAYQLIEMYRRGEVLPDEVVNISQPYYSENKVYYFQLPTDLLGEKIPGVSLQAVSQTEELRGATASAGETRLN